MAPQIGAVFWGVRILVKWLQVKGVRILRFRDDRFRQWNDKPYSKPNLNFFFMNSAPDL